MTNSQDKPGLKESDVEKIRSVLSQQADIEEASFSAVVPKGIIDREAT